jgi:hypothetical protein
MQIQRKISVAAFILAFVVPAFAQQQESAPVQITE